MRAVVITKHGGPEVLQVQERPEPVARPGHVVVDVGAAGSQNLTSKLVVRLILRDPVLDPISQSRGPFFAQKLAIDLQEVGPFVGPVLNVFATADEAAD